MGLKIKIMVLDRLIMNTPIQEVILPSATGQIGILEGHAPLATALEIGVLRIKVEQKWKPIVVLGGIARIKNDEVLVLVSGTQEVEKESYDEDQEIFRQAIENLSTASTTKQKIQASQRLKRASARLQAYQFLN